MKHRAFFKLVLAKAKVAKDRQACQLEPFSDIDSTMKQELKEAKAPMNAVVEVSDAT